MLGLELDRRDSKAIEEIMAAVEINCTGLPSVLGRLQFADLQVLGRVGKLVMADVGQHAAGCARRSRT